jgi:DNA-binding LytR/AlgR family response regulator
MQAVVFQTIQSVQSLDTFVVVDRSYIVNAFHIMTLKNQEIVLRNRETIPVSRPKLSYVKQEIMRIWRS